MKQIPQIILGVAVIITATILTELFLTVPGGNFSMPIGKVLGAKKKAAKKATKKKPTTTKAANPAPPAVQKSAGVDVSLLEREINILYTDGKIIGPDHYNRLKSELDSKAAAGANAAKIAKLREWLETVNPAQVKPTGSTAPPQNQTENCPDDQRPTLTADITDFSKIQKITPPGSPVAPDDQDKYKGHSFIWTDYQRVPIYAPTDAILNSVAYQADNASSPYQYVLGLKVKANCNYSIKFDHIDEVIPAIQAVAPAPTIVNRSNTAPSTEPPKKISIEFKAGDLLGYTQGTRQAGNWDFGFYNTNKEGPLAPLGAFGLGKHALCWVDYYSSEKQNLYRSLLTGNKLVCSY